MPQFSTGWRGAQRVGPWRGFPWLYTTLRWPHRAETARAHSCDWRSAAPGSAPKPKEKTMDFKSLSTLCRGRGRLALAVFVLLGLAGAGVAWAAVHHSAGSFHSLGHRHGLGEFRLHADFLVDRALSKADASDEQRRQVEAIVGRVFDERQAFHAEQEALH